MQRTSKMTVVSVYAEDDTEFEVFGVVFSYKPSVITSDPSDSRPEEGGEAEIINVYKFDKSGKRIESSFKELEDLGLVETVEKLLIEQNEEDSKLSLDDISPEGTFERIEKRMRAMKPVKDDDATIPDPDPLV